MAGRTGIINSGGGNPMVVLFQGNVLFSFPMKLYYKRYLCVSLYYTSIYFVFNDHILNIISVIVDHIFLGV